MTRPTGAPRGKRRSAPIHESESDWFRSASFVSEDHSWGGDVAEALHYLIDVGDGLGSAEFEIDGPRLEEHSQVLRSGRFGGRLLQSLQMTIRVEPGNLS